MHLLYRGWHQNDDLVHVMFTHNIWFSAISLAAFAPETFSHWSFLTFPPRNICTHKINIQIIINFVRFEWRPTFKDLLSDPAVLWWPEPHLYQGRDISSILIGRAPTLLRSHWSRASECWNIFMHWKVLLLAVLVMLRQQPYAIKNQLGHPKPPTRGNLLAPRWFFMA